jgi:uncharacterized protein DUF3592
MTIAIKLEKSDQRVRFLKVLGYILVFCTLVLIAMTAIDAYKENVHAHWPSAVATITQQTVRKIPAGSRGEWYIESSVRFSVGGEELRSSTRSGGGAFWEEFSMRRWASQHPPGTSLSIRYDPQHPGNIVPDAGTMPGSEPQAEQDLGLTLLFMLLSAACMTIGRVLQCRQEESNMPNRDNTNE